MLSLFEVNIFFETKSVEMVTESPKVSGTDLLSNIGGAFSLYLGISLIALFETFEVVIRMFEKATRLI